uniref:NSFL1 cofactor p47 n=1 Tax=Hucho hucho TaxID=62062 RepID=A0A4W5NTD8_9TELE
MADQEVSVRQFVTVTDVDDDRARFFLESAGWDLQLALASFFEDVPEDDIVTLPQPESGGSSVPHPTGPSENRVTSFRDMMHEEVDDSDEEEGQRFFAGGSERSGQQIVGPPKKKSSNEVVEDLFKGAKEHGAVPVEKAGRGPGEPSRARCISSSWTAQDLPLLAVRCYPTSTKAPASSQIFLGGMALALTLRSNRSQMCSMELRAGLFAGHGRTLTFLATPELVSAPCMGDQDQVASEAQAIASVNLDASKPVTNIQIRLADGGRLVQKFNHTHRVSDVRQFVVGARPLMAATEFVLMTTFPNKELTDESQSLQDANLLNAVIVQRLK